MQKIGDAKIEEILGSELFEALRDKIGEPPDDIMKRAADLDKARDRNYDNAAETVLKNAIAKVMFKASENAGANAELLKALVTMAFIIGHKSGESLVLGEVLKSVFKKLGKK